MNVKDSRTLTTTTTGSKNSQKNQQSDKQSDQCSVPPKGPFLTDSWSWKKSSTRHTLSNRGLSEIHLRLVNLTENAVCHTFKGSLFVAFRILLQLTYCSFTHQCEHWLQLVWCI